MTSVTRNLLGEVHLKPLSTILAFFSPLLIAPPLQRELCLLLAYRILERREPPIERIIAR